MSPEKVPPSPKENWDTFEARLFPFSQEDKTRIEFAYQLSKYAHRGQRRIGGERYFEHPRSVSLILLDECGIRDASVICAALLHDSLEDTAIFGNPTKLRPARFTAFSAELISRIFYPETAEMVQSLTEPYIDGVEVKDKKQAKAVKYDRLRNASEEALLIKMADRLHNLRTFFPKRGEKTPEQKITETQEILIPIFRRAEGKYPTQTQHLLEEINKAIAALKLRNF
ncbi:MAG: HD domain-containing protein [Patescibacteria group bacterium]|nr:HD domain-containing protein [Patescibacteria group bacterium]